jgi:hypothetical protein
MRPGHTANPGGRPKVWREFQEAMRERSPEAVRRIDEALGSQDPALYQWAAEKVLAYAWGRPPQRVQVGGDEESPPAAVSHQLDLSRLSAEQLRALLELSQALRTGGGAGP